MNERGNILTEGRRVLDEKDHTQVQGKGDHAVEEKHGGAQRRQSLDKGGVGLEVQPEEEEEAGGDRCDVIKRRERV